MNHRVLFSCLCALSVIFVSSCNETEPWDDTPPVEEPTISICGNGVLETGEQCDGHLLADTGACGVGQRVQSFTCDPATCQIATKSCEVVSTPGYCGNGTIDSNEECDGTAVATGIAICDPGQIEKGTIVCKSDCTIDRAASCEAMETPTGCGNGIMDAGEECDGAAMPTAITCPTGKQPKPQASWTCQNCKIDLELSCEPIPATCGNDVLDAGEECDGAVIADDIAICAPDQVEKAPIVCKSDCTIDRAASCEAVEPPTTCGNDVLDAGEECDGAAVADDIAICAPDQVKKDPIVCKSDCTIDRAASCEAVEPPTTCGNDVLDAGEECDGAAVADDIAICAPGQIEKGTIVCKSDCTIDRAASCEAIDVPTTCNNSTLDIGELCDTSLSAYTPLACIYKDGLTDITYKADKTKSLPDSGSVFYIGKSLNTCSAACELVTNSCVAVQVSDLNLDKISTYDASYVSRTLNSKSKNYGKSNYDMRSLGISTNLTTSFDGSSGIYSYAFKDWDNTVPENGTFNDKKYIQYLPLHHNGVAYNRYEYVSIYFSYRTQDETSPSQFSVTLYKASDNNMNASTTYEFVGVISNFTVAKTGQWNGSGELVIPMQFLKDKDIKYPAVRINSYGGKTGTLYVKDLVVTLFNLK